MTAFVNLGLMLMVILQLSLGLNYYEIGNENSDLVFEFGRVTEGLKMPVNDFYVAYLTIIVRNPTESLLSLIADLNLSQPSVL